MVAGNRPSTQVTETADERLVIALSAVDSLCRNTNFPNLGKFLANPQRVSYTRKDSAHCLMKLLNTPLLEAFKLKHASARGAIDVWKEHVGRARWTSPHDVKRDFPSADTLGDNRLIFNIKGNSYRLVVKAKYQNGLVLIEWVGTHAEYDKKKF